MSQERETAHTPVVNISPDSSPASRHSINLTESLRSQPVLDSSHPMKQNTMTLDLNKLGVKTPEENLSKLSSPTTGARMSAKSGILTFSEKQEQMLKELEKTSQDPRANLLSVLETTNSARRKKSDQDVEEDAVAVNLIDGSKEKVEKKATNMAVMSQDVRSSIAGESFGVMTKEGDTFTRNHSNNVTDSLQSTSRSIQKSHLKKQVGFDTFNSKRNSQISKNSQFKEYREQRIDRDLKAPQELDMFSLETKSRKTISELIRPVIADMDVDRRKMAETVVMLTKLMNRIDKLEYILNVSSKKPKVFLDIENNFADFKMRSKQDKQELQSYIDQVSKKVDILQSQHEDTTLNMTSIQNLIDLRDKQINILTEHHNNFQERLNNEIASLSKQQSTTELTVSSKLRGFDQICNVNTSKINEFRSKVDELEKLVTDTHAMTSKNSVQAQMLSDTKLDSTEYKTDYKALKDQVEVIRYAAYDTFRVLQATDNYIEKYLPFQVQTMISTNILSFLQNSVKMKESESNQKIEPWIKDASTDESQDFNDQPQKNKDSGQQPSQSLHKQLEERLNKKLDELHKNFKAQEYLNFKTLHRKVLNDNGNPTIKKTAFRMPGYRKVCQDNNLEEYYIDNEAGFKYRGRHSVGGPSIEEDIVPDTSSNNSAYSFSKRQEFDGKKASYLDPRYPESPRKVSSAGKKSFTVGPSPRVERTRNKGISGQHRSKGLLGSLDALNENAKEIKNQRQYEFSQVLNMRKLMEDSKRPVSPFLSRAIKFKEVELQAQKRNTQRVLNDKNTYTEETEIDPQRLTPVRARKRSQGATFQSNSGAISKGKDTKISNPNKAKQSAESVSIPISNQVHRSNKFSSGQDSQYAEQYQDPDEYHKRRKRTQYLVGFEDMEDEVVQTIMSNNALLMQLIDKLKETQKDFANHKKYIEGCVNKQDFSFQDEVRSQMKEQNCFLFEIQSNLKQDSDKVLNLQQKQYLDIEKILRNYEGLSSNLKRLFDQVQSLESQPKQSLRSSPRRNSPKKTILQQALTEMDESLNMNHLQQTTIKSHELLIDMFKLQNVYNHEIHNLTTNLNNKKTFQVHSGGPFGSALQKKQQSVSIPSTLTMKTGLKDKIDTLKNTEMPNSETMSEKRPASSKPVSSHDNMMSGKVSAHGSITNIQTMEVGKRDEMNISEKTHKVDCFTLIHTLEKIRLEFEQLATLYQSQVSIMNNTHLDHKEEQNQDLMSHRTTEKKEESTFNKQVVKQVDFTLNLPHNFGNKYSPGQTQSFTSPNVLKTKTTQGTTIGETLRSESMGSSRQTRRTIVTKTAFVSQQDRRRSATNKLLTPQTYNIPSFRSGVNLQIEAPSFRKNIGNRTNTFRKVGIHQELGGLGPITSRQSQANSSVQSSGIRTSVIQAKQSQNQTLN